MSTTEQIYALLVAANPVPDAEASPEPVAQTRPHLYVVDPRRTVMQTQHQPQQKKTTEVSPPRRTRHAWLYAAAAFILVVVVGATAWMLQPDSDEAAIAPADPEAELAGTSELATVEAATAAYNAYDADTYTTYWVDGTEGPAGIVVGSPEWQQFLAEEKARGIQITLSDCEATDGTARCVETYEETLLSGKAGVVITWEVEYTFNEDGRIATFASGINMQGSDAIGPFEDALGRWMATAHPEVFETYYVPDFYTRKYENWYTPEGAAELSRLIDEFIAQSETYPLP